MDDILCPVCNKPFTASEIDVHVDKCIFLHSNDNKTTSKNNAIIEKSPKTSFLHVSNPMKKQKLEQSPSSSVTVCKKDKSVLPRKNQETVSADSVLLAEKMRPTVLNEYIGQSHVLGKDKILGLLIGKKDIPSMILWGPPGCGKTSLANVIANITKSEPNLRFVKLSATMSGINDVKEVVKVAKNEAKFKRKTILFMDEIHRFNKLQQDTFLPHIENGTLILIGATTENPSFSLNSALLSRCRVIVLEKLSVDDVLEILLRAASVINTLVMDNNKPITIQNSSSVPRIIIEKTTLKWLAEICDGDARIALSSFQIALQAKDPGG